MEGKKELPLARIFKKRGPLKIGKEKKRAHLSSGDVKGGDESLVKKVEGGEKVKTDSIPRRGKGGEKRLSLGFETGGKAHHASLIKKKINERHQTFGQE